MNHVLNVFLEKLNLIYHCKYTEPIDSSFLMNYRMSYDIGPFLVLNFLARMNLNWRSGKLMKTSQYNNHIFILSFQLPFI
jgi:hypothetical protein